MERGIATTLLVLLAALGCTAQIEHSSDMTSGGGAGTQSSSGQGGAGTQSSSGQGGAGTQSSSGQGGGGGAPQCIPEIDCPVAVPECRKAVACENGQCVFEDAAEGSPVSQQVPGDCAARVCDGQGTTKIIAAPTDVPGDGNPCTLDSCNGMLPVHTPQFGVNFPCYTGPAGTLGAGICKAGVTYCDAQGNPGPCVGEVLPQAENCDAAMIDDDCDGKINDEGPDCVCGDGLVSVDMGEECDDGATLDGDPCSPDCKEQEVLEVAAGDYFSCARLSHGRVKCWGWNSSGRLGLGDKEDRGNQPNEMGAALPAIDLGTGKAAKAIEAGAVHACALLDDGRVKCWGWNPSGGLGLGDVLDRGDGPNEMGDNLPSVNLGTGRTATAITADWNHTCALLDNGAVKCWGSNTYGGLGQGHIQDIGDDPNEMGDNLPAIDLGSGATAIAVQTGNAHTCALLGDGRVKCWGYNLYGQCGLGHGQDVGDDPNEMGDHLPAVDLGTGKTAVAIAVGRQHTCARLHDSTVKCWGRNADGVLGLGTEGPGRGDDPSEMGDNLPAIDLGTGNTAVSVDAHESVCVRLGDSRVKCWGMNLNANLGLGDQQHRGDDPNEMGDNLPALDLGAGKSATAVGVGWAHTCAILNDGSLKCWGGNFYGNLGLGDMQPRGDVPGEMGNALPTVKLFSDLW